MFVSRDQSFRSSEKRAAENVFRFLTSSPIHQSVSITEKKNQTIPPTHERDKTNMQLRPGILPPLYFYYHTSTSINASNIVTITPTERFLNVPIKPKHKTRQPTHQPYVPHTMFDLHLHFRTLHIAHPLQSTTKRKCAVKVPALSFHHGAHNKRRAATPTKQNTREPASSPQTSTSPRQHNTLPRT